MWLKIYSTVRFCCSSCSWLCGNGRVGCLDGRHYFFIFPLLFSDEDDGKESSKDDRHGYAVQSFVARHPSVLRLYVCVHAWVCECVCVYMCACVHMHVCVCACGAGKAQWLECQTHDWHFLCWLLFRYPFHPRVTAVAHERSQSFCQKCSGRLQLNTHTPYVCGFAWSDMVHGCMVYTELALRWQQFHVAPAIYECCMYTTVTLVDIQKCAVKS